MIHEVHEFSWSEKIVKKDFTQSLVLNEVKERKVKEKDTKKKIHEVKN